MKNDDLKVFASEDVDVSNGFRIGSTDDNTNRNVLHHDSEIPTDSVKIDKFIKTYVEKGGNELNDFLRSLVKDFSLRFIHPKSTFYRGIPASSEPKVDGNKIGPSSAPKNNRYSADGEMCLYLIDDWTFLPQELKKLGCGKFLIQDYDNIPFETLRIADLSSENTALDNSLALAFQRTESGRTAAGCNFEDVLEKSGKSKYLVSQLLASFFKAAGWDGFLIPGVHGGSGRHYRNLAVWGNALDSWKDWTTTSYIKKTI